MAAKSAPKKSATSAGNKKTPAASPNSKKPPLLEKSYKKSEILSDIAESVNLPRKQVEAVLLRLQELIAMHLSQKTPVPFSLPGLLKVQVITKPAVKARKGINPFTKEPAVFKARPARKVVKIKALKKLKEMI